MAGATPSRPSAKDRETAARLGTVRQAGTQAELLVRHAVRGCGRHYRVNGFGLPGRPDLSNKGARWVIFVHGCYWHHHAGCRRATIPKHNRDFWVSKFLANQQRDERVVEELSVKGYRTLVIWECETSDASGLKARLSSFFRSLPDQARAKRGA